MGFSFQKMSLGNYFLHQITMTKTYFLEDFFFR